MHWWTPNPPRKLDIIYTPLIFAARRLHGDHAGAGRGHVPLPGARLLLLRHHTRHRPRLVIGPGGGRGRDHHNSGANNNYWGANNNYWGANNNYRDANNYHRDANNNHSLRHHNNLQLLLRVGWLSQDTSHHFRLFFWRKTTLTMKQLDAQKT